ncbi:hypothetical protein BDR26DRAFT_923262 [Obelidium mucronatum]|nr:hypothetical protein BDR26DRAFT_923262 [Obelidium mucronatum]
MDLEADITTLDPFERLNALNKVLHKCNPKQRSTHTREKIVLYSSNTSSLSLTLQYNQQSNSIVLTNSSSPSSSSLVTNNSIDAITTTTVHESTSLAAQSNPITTPPPPPTTPENTITESSTAIQKYFKTNTKSPWKRLIYAVAGILFLPESPHPWGGSRTKPGYSECQAKTAQELLLYLLTGAYKSYWGCRGSKVLEVLGEACNVVVGLETGGYRGVGWEKGLEVEGGYNNLGVEAASRVAVGRNRKGQDLMDELCLKGMKKCGAVEWYGAVYLPVDVRSWWSDFGSGRVEKVGEEEGCGSSLHAATRR